MSLRPLNSSRARRITRAHRRHAGCTRHERANRSRLRCFESRHWAMEGSDFRRRHQACVLWFIPPSQPLPDTWCPSSAPSSAPAVNHQHTHTTSVNFATEWLDENGRVCPKVVDYATQCPKGHALVPYTCDGMSALAQRLMCRICHAFTEHERALQWLVCSVTGCCAQYAVCSSCLSVLQQAPLASAAGDNFPSLVCTICQSCGAAVARITHAQRCRASL